jgi:hypothetical protein
MFADIAPRESFAIRKSSGYFEQDSGGSGFSAPQYQDFHADSPQQVKC